MEKFVERICEIVQSYKDRMFAVSEDIYNHPELGNEEFRSSKVLADELEKHGFAITMGLGSQQTAFRAVKPGKAKKPVIAFLAEYDALPIVGHGCGHNWIGTVSTFAGIVVGELIKELEGTIEVIGTPAEESYGGKIVLLEEGFFDNTDMALMTHPSNETVPEYQSLAAQVIEVEFIGKPAHAAASPWLGVNALDALIQSFVAIDNLKKQLNPAFRIPGIIKHGGDRPNVVPERTVGCFSIRTEKLSELDLVKEKLMNIFRGAAMATGCTFSVRETEKPYAPMLSNKALVSLFDKYWKMRGGTFIKNPLKGYGSLDVGNVSQKIPCLHPSISIVDDFKVSGHTKEFGEATLSEKGRAQLIRTVETLAMIAVESMQNPQLIDQMKEELKNTPK